MKQDESKGNNCTHEDCVVFMTAYKISGIEKKIKLLSRKKEVSEILKNHHIKGVMNKDKMLTQKGILKVIQLFDAYNQCTKFKFEHLNREHSMEDYTEEIDDMGWGLALFNSAKVLLDNDFLDITYVISMESFLVEFDARIKIGHTEWRFDL